MKQFVIGILKESKAKEHRVPLTPADAQLLLENYPNLLIKAEPSEKRVYTNRQYTNVGVKITDNLLDCNLLLGLKEVDIQKVIPGKTYLFFAHVAKMQHRKKSYFKQLASKKITLVDYEYLTNKNEKRIAAFGYWAGIAGLYNAFYALGKRYKTFELPLVSSFSSFNALFNKLNNLVLPPVKIIITGAGNSAKGVSDTLKKLGIKGVSQSAFLNKSFNFPVYCILSPRQFLVQKDGLPYSKADFKANRDQYISIFHQYAEVADLYFACHYWENNMPLLLTNNHLASKESRLKIVADISCDINGPIACTLKESTIENPFYDFNPLTQNIEPAFSSPDNINVMAVGNLPTMLPFDSSNYFSDVLTKKILPHFISEKDCEIIENATLLKNGQLTCAFNDLYDYLNT